MTPHPHRSCNAAPRPVPPVWLRPWTFTWTLISGVLALAWLVLRSGPKPSRMAYPCQQAAFSAAVLAFGAPVVALLVGARRRLASALHTPRGLTFAAVGLAASCGVWGYLRLSPAAADLNLEPPPEYRAAVYHVSECPADPIGARFVGLDNLLSLMGREGLKFYQSAQTSLTAGPHGLIAADDTVILKINYQWSERGGTNTDVLRGLVHRIVNHPDGFNGEIVVCENAQFNSTTNFDRPSNNAQDYGQSPHDVVVEFQTLGYTISHYDWTLRRYTQVNEYADGDLTDGYVVGVYDSQIQGRVSYPKFQTDYGTYISLKHGIWDPGSGSYDAEPLKFINMPVLKSHHSTYGATVCIKDYMGVVTGALSTNSHSGIRYGLLGALLGEIRLADLNLLDSIWINANPFSGPGTTYAGATRRDELVASTDPIAADLWAVKHILIPGFRDNGYMPPWPEPSADPDDPTSDFRQYLDNSMARILMAGYQVTNDPQQIDLFTWNGDGDFDSDSDVDLDDYLQFAECFTGPDGDPLPPACTPGDFDDDLDVDCADWDEFVAVWSGIDALPQLPACGCAADLGGDGTVDAADLAQLLGNWGPCPGCPADLTGDDAVDASDLALLLGSWGPC